MYGTSRVNVKVEQEIPAFHTLPISYLRTCAKITRQWKSTLRNNTPLSSENLIERFLSSVYAFYAPYIILLFLCKMHGHAVLRHKIQSYE